MATIAILFSNGLLSLLSICIAAAASTKPTAGQARIAPESPPHISRIETRLVSKDGPQTKSTLQERMAALNVPGVSVAVIDHGNVVWAKGYGVVEVGRDDPVTGETLFQAASISKPVTAMAVMRLVQSGKLSLDDAVNLHLTQWKIPDNEFTAKSPVTLRQLLSHSGGLTVHGFGGYRRGSALPTLVQILDGKSPANSSPIRVDIQPGSKPRYSGGGYCVAQLLITETVKKSFDEFMSETVLLPLEMSHSTYQQPLPDDQCVAAATGHDEKGKPIQGKHHVYPEMAAAGLWTTPSDLARFVIELESSYRGQTGAVLSPPVARQMLTRQPGDAGGLGVFLSGTETTFRFDHGGSNAGYRCYMIGFPQSKQGAVIMTNSDNGDRLIQELVAAIGAEYQWPGYARKKSGAGK